MGIITAIESTKRKNNRKNIYIDDEFACTLSDFCVFKNKLVVGLAITTQQLEEIQVQSDVDVYFTKVVQMQMKSMKTQKQIEDYLLSEGCVPKTIEILLNKLQEYKYVNDEIYAKKYLDKYKKSKGKQKIKYELRQKGIEDEIIDRVLSGVENQLDEVWDLSTKYMRNKQVNYENLNKLIRYLGGKGFGMDDIGVAIQRLREERGNEDWE